MVKVDELLVQVTQVIFTVTRQIYHFIYPLGYRWVRLFRQKGLARGVIFVVPFVFVRDIFETFEYFFGWHEVTVKVQIANVWFVKMNSRLIWRFN